MLYKPRSVTELCLALLAVIEMVVASELSGRLVFLFAQLPLDYGFVDLEIRGVATVLSFTLFGFPYMAVLTYDALAQRNIFMACGLCAYNCWPVVYFALFLNAVQTFSRPSILNFALREARTLVISNVILIAFCTVMQLALTWRLYKDWSRAIFRLLGADRKLQSLYRNYQILTTLLKFDFAFFTGALIQLDVITAGRNNAERFTTIAMTACVLPLLLGTSKSTTKENLLGSQLCILFVSGYEAFFVFKLTRMYAPDFETFYISLKGTLTFWLVMTTAYAVATVIVMVVCARNFENGLKRYLFISRDAPSGRTLMHGTSRQLKYDRLADDGNPKTAQSSAIELRTIRSVPQH